MNRRTLFLAAAAAITALVTACSDISGPKPSSLPLNPRAAADSLICTVSNGSQTCSPA